MQGHQAAAGELAGTVDHFLQVTWSYLPRLFSCSEAADLSRTNNSLEQACGSHRNHERRATGRRGRIRRMYSGVSPRLGAGLATRQRDITAGDIAGADRSAWRAPRASLGLSGNGGWTGISSAATRTPTSVEWRPNSSSQASPP